MPNEREQSQRLTVIVIVNDDGNHMEILPFRVRILTNWLIFLVIQLAPIRKRYENAEEKKKKSQKTNTQNKTELKMPLAYHCEPNTLNKNSCLASLSIGFSFSIQQTIETEGLHSSSIFCFSSAFRTPSSMNRITNIANVHRSRWPL